MELKNITIENFKGIKKPISINLKPITVLFGLNNAGKSTIIQAINYIRQIIVGKKISPDRNDNSSLNFGGFPNIVYNQDIDLPILFNFNFIFEDTNFFDYTTENIDKSLNFYERPHEITDDFPIDKIILSDIEWIAKKIKELDIGISIQFDKEKQTPYIKSYTAQVNSSRLFQIDFTLNRLHPIEISFYKHPILPKCIEDTVKNKVIQDAVSYNMSGKLEEEKLGEKLILPPIPEKKDIRYLDGDLLFKEVVNQNSTLPQSNKLINFKESFWEFACKPEEELFYTNFISTLTTTPIHLLEKTFSNSCHIGPLRELPDRNHIQKNHPDQLRWTSGLAAYDIILNLKTSSELIEEINTWLSNNRFFNTGYELEIKKFTQLDDDSESMKLLKKDTLCDEEIKQIQSYIKNCKKICKYNLVDIVRGNKLAMQDVGTGISQLFPIIVACLSLKNSILTIEQPDLHIHAALEVVLSDLFIESAMNQEKHNLLLIETHSEPLILRLLKRIKQTTRGQNESMGITPKNVSLLNLSSTPNGSLVKNIRIDKYGRIVDQCPGGFFEEDFKELF